jgi:para-aminobenzoate synthetase/4-amino-4-deoxychorismate lyase
VCLAEEPVDRENVFLYHKTTRREVYERALAACPEADDVLLWNEAGELTEACRANLVVELDGERLTPPVRSGLLAGTYRRHLLATGAVREAVVRVADLERANRIWLANSVRGMQAVSRIRAKARS